MRRNFFNYAAASSVLAAVLGWASFSPAAQSDAPKYVPGEVLVVLKPSSRSSEERMLQLAQMLQQTAGGASVVRQQHNIALLKVDANADIESLAAAVSAMAGVKYAQPNYIYHLPKVTADLQQDITPPVSIQRKSAGEKWAADETRQEISVAALRSMKNVKGGTAQMTYPNDPYLWSNWGWWWTGADIVSSNKTKSVGVCVLDTGVDHTHPDLKGTVVKGYDFVNDDKDPMDDHGHGTHVAGIIAAKANNKQGISGLSTGKVISAKVLNAQGWGTTFNIAMGVRGCADRRDVGVLNMSLGGGIGSDTYMHDAVDYAVNQKGKLIVASAGNDNTDDMTYAYPAAFAAVPEFQNKVLAVGASDYEDKASFSNYGSWVSVVAPGAGILSTLPWNKPFMMDPSGYSSGYASLSGTSMAAPFVAAAAARRWGYKPGDSNAAIGEAVKGSGWEIYTSDEVPEGTTWPTSMAGVHEMNVADLLDRAAIWGYVANATTSLPVPKASLKTCQGRVCWTGFNYYGLGNSDIINLPVGGPYNTVAAAPGLSAGYQPALQHQGALTLNEGGGWYFAGVAAIPNKSGRFDVMAWGGAPLHLWLPPAVPYRVSWDTMGTLLDHPKAIYNNSGSSTQSITVATRPRYSSKMYYPGEYQAGVANDYPGEYDINSYMYIWKNGKIQAAAIKASWLPAGGNNDPAPCSKAYWIPFKIDDSGVPLRLTGDAACVDAPPYIYPVPATDI
jgi:hypothetical protein